MASLVHRRPITCACKCSCTTPSSHRFQCFCDSHNGRHAESRPSTLCMDAEKKTCGRWAHNFYSYTKPEPRERGIRILHFTCGGSSSDVCACYACHHVDRAYWGLNSLSALISPLSAKREPLLRFAVWSTGKKTLLLWTERKAFSKHLLNICTITSPKASAAFRHSCVPWRPSRPREQTNRISA